MLDRSLLVAPIAAFLICLAVTRIVRRIALAVGFVDNPDRRRKLHEAPIPLGGGLAIWFATWCGWSVSVLSGALDVSGAVDSAWFYVGLAIATFVMLGLGAFDDRYGLRGRHKLAGQVVAAAILVGLGLRVDAWTCFGVQVHLGIFAWPVTVLVILLVVNAFNLIDGMDGFCAGLGLVASLAIAVLACWSGRLGDMVIALAVAGALAGFLWHNLPPARIYLGDAGSLTLGMIIAALAVRSCSDGPSTAVSCVPLMALMLLPLMDVVTALGRRWLTGRSLFTADRGHLHHCLGNRLGSPVAALGAALCLATIGAGGAVLAKAFGMGDSAACLAIVVCVGLLVGTNTFGASETRLLLFRLQTALAPLWTGMSARRRGIRQECHLHGIRDWAGIWDALIRDVEACGVRRIELAIDMAAAGEVYHGLWSSPTVSEDGPSWSVVHTLYAGGVSAGILQMAGGVDASGARYLDKVEEFVRVIERHLESSVLPPPPSAVPVPSCVNISVAAELT